MTESTNGQATKRQELLTLARQAIDGYAAKINVQIDGERALSIATHVVDSMVEITPPRISLSTDLITMSSGGRSGASSVKPGNLLLDMKKLVSKTATGVLTFTGAMQLPWTVPFAALTVRNDLWSMLKIELTERQAAVFWTMWLRADREDRVSDRDLLAYVNEELSRHGRSGLTRQELDETLTDLQRLGCIERADSDGDRWWLREWVRIKYS